MAAGKSGGSQQGNQNQSGTSDQTYTGTTTPTPTRDWGNISTYLRDNINSNGGLTPDQQASVNHFSGQMGPNNPVTSATDYANKVLGANYAPGRHEAYQLGAGSQISADKVAGQQGAGFMSAYQDPYQQQVVDATTADANQNLSTGLNQLKASYGGQLGNGREGVAAGQAVGDYTRGLNTTLGNLRSQGFTTAAGLGQNDASRVLQGDVANQGANLQAGAYNQADQTQRDTANMASKYQNDQQSMTAVRDWVNNAVTGNTAGNNAATSVYNMSGGGLNNLTSFLGTQNPAFGQTVGGSSHTDSKGNTQSSGSSKGGGLSIG